MKARKRVRNYLVSQSTQGNIGGTQNVVEIPKTSLLDRQGIKKIKTSTKHKETSNVMRRTNGVRLPMIPNQRPDSDTLTESDELIPVKASPSTFSGNLEVTQSLEPQ